MSTTAGWHWSFAAGGEYNSRQKRDKLWAMSSASSVKLLLTRSDYITLHADMDSLYTAMTYRQYIIKKNPGSIKTGSKLKTELTAHHLQMQNILQYIYIPTRYTM